ncbi:MAG: DUF6056 family protein [Clostridia bacterium]|nr:DUF6056 family protein [Clostridia bacterium]
MNLDRIRKNIPYVFVIIGMIIIHMPMTLDISDDGTLGRTLYYMNLWDAAKRIYLTGSGKVLTDLMAMIFVYLPHIIWKLLDACVFSAIAWCIMYIFTNRSTISKWISAIAIFLYPMSLMLSAGYCMTSTNYVWTTLAVLVAIIPLRKGVDGININIAENIIYVVACFYACSQEQSAAILIASYALYIITHIKQHISKEIFFNWIVAIFMLIVLFTSPGHITKSVPVYNTVAVPDYLRWGILDKIYYGFTTTMSFFISDFRIISFVMTSILALLVWIKQKKWAYRIISVIPMIMSVLVPMFAHKHEQYFKEKYNWSHGMYNLPMVNSYNYDDIKSYLAVIVAIAFCICVGLVLYLAYGNTWKTAMIFIIALAGLSSRIVMGFSHTLYGSGSRTFTYMYFCLIIMIVVMGTDILDDIKNKTIFNEKCIPISKGGFAGIFAVGIVSILCVCMGLYISSYKIKEINLPNEVQICRIEKLTSAINVSEKGNHQIISGWCIKKGEDSGFFDMDIILKRESDGIYIKVPTYFVQNNNVTEFMNDGYDYANCGFKCRINEKQLDKNEKYRICIWYRNNGNNLLQESSNVIDIQQSTATVQKS